MNLLLGIAFALASVLAGYVLHHGPLGVFVDAWTEYIVIFGSGLGVFIAANGLGVLKRTITAILHCIRPDPFSKAAFLDLMGVVYRIATIVRRDGILALEPHVERPENSDIISRSEHLLHHPEAMTFFCDNLRLLLVGRSDPAYLDGVMETDLEAMTKEAHVVPDAVQGAADAMPALGIVACVLGVVITMGKIGGDAREIGMAVGVALVGTFLGISASYLILSPMARAILLRHGSEEVYLGCIRESVLRIAAGETPNAVIEAIRRCIPPTLRPDASEAETYCKALGR